MPAKGALVVIPARYGSTRFPGKPLAEIGGVPMIVRVAERARRIKGVDRVVVATDDRRILDVVEASGAEGMMTRKAHSTGTSRVIEVAGKFPHSIVVNLQGDEPFIPVGAVGRLVEAMKKQRGIVMGTLAIRSDDKEAYLRPDVVKVVCSREGDALYFSRSPLPGHFSGPDPVNAKNPLDSGGKKRSSDVSFLQHIGVYAFRRSFLLGYSSMRQGPLEKSERLEQLRALENGYRIRVLLTKEKSLGVDRPEDIKRVEKRIKRI